VKKKKKVETGIGSGEAWRLTQSDVDTTTKTVRITPEKNSNPRISHVSPKLAAMLDARASPADKPPAFSTWRCGGWDSNSQSSGAISRKTPLFLCDIHYVLAVPWGEQVFHS